MKKIKMSRRNRIQMAIALILCAVSIIVTSGIQHGWGQIEMSEIVLTTEAGNLTGYLFRPKTATEENPAPAVVCSHGYLNNREMQDCNYIELARRGYVVISMDDFSHGNSDVPAAGYEDTALIKTNGMSAFVEYLATLPYVDKTQIGCTGHSMGGSYTIQTMTYYTELEREALEAGTDPEEAHALNLVNTGVIVGNYPTAMAQNEEGNTFLCHCTVIGAKYDEFFFENTAVLLTSDNSKKLVSNILGEEAAMPLTEGETYISPDTGYTVTLYNPAQFHATNHFSVKCVKYLLESFERSMPAPVKLSSSNQVWLIKEIFNCLGLIGFFLFVVPCTEQIMNIPLFASLKKEPVYCELPENKGRYVRRSIMQGVWNSLLIVPLMLIGYLLLCNSFWPQDTTGGIGLWSAGCALVVLGYIKKDLGIKKLKGRTEELGTKTTWGEFFKALLLALCVTVWTYMLLFIADALGMTDFRIWSFDIRAFPVKKIWVAVKYLPIFAGFYIVQSLSVSKSTFASWSETKQVTVCGLVNIIAPALMLIITYAPTPLFQATTWVALFSSVGLGMLATVFALIPILLLPMVPILFITAAIAVRCYRQTGNIWIGGLINAMLVTMITVANTSFTYAY